MWAFALFVGILQVQGLYRTESSGGIAKPFRRMFCSRNNPELCNKGQLAVQSSVDSRVPLRIPLESKRSTRSLISKTSPFSPSSTVASSTAAAAISASELQPAPTLYSPQASLNIFKRLRSTNTKAKALWALQPVWEFYATNLATYPLVVKMITNGFITSGGDVLAQKLEHRNNSNEPGKEPAPKRFDLRRSLVMATIGFAYLAPLLHFWYEFMHAYFAPGAQGARLLAMFPADFQGKALTTLAFVLADQLIFSPIAIGAFFIVNGLVSAVAHWDLGKIKESLSTLRQQYLRTLIMNYRIWPGAQVINFALVPKDLQVLFF
mmetsp:Transcript_29750/g.72474  ORF Transcript_29750/g.72474 Transcript_29750/m.72474 type:complete len:321 (+) Transcript_29750:298-1260(+)